MPGSDHISVVLAADEIMAMPTAAAIGALAATRASRTYLDIHVLSCGISRSNRDRISGMAGEGVQVTCHEIKGAAAAKLERLYRRSARPYPPANYARLLVGDVLPAEVRRVVYMDVDTTALTDLAPFWNTEFGDAVALVVRDLPHEAGQVQRLLATFTPEDLARYGFTADTLYFQAGVIGLDLDAFRAGIADEVFDILLRYPQLSFPDQDALNLVLARRRRLVDPRWNQMTGVYWYGEGEALPYEEDLFEALKNRPCVVHYSGRPKPWETGCDHPLAGAWRAAFARTPWAARPQTAMARARLKAARARRVLRKKLYRLLRR